MAGKRIEPETLARAEDLLRDPNVSYAEVNRQTGISTDTLSRRFPRDRRPGGRPAPPVAPLFAADPPPANEKTADPRPAGRTRRRGQKRNQTGPTDAQLEDLLRKIAKSPAFLTKTIVRCDYCTHHFIDTAPEVAAELMELAEDEPDLREMLEFIYKEWRKFAWASALGGWMGVPIAHHLMPERWYSVLVLLAGMPPRATSSHDHTHGTAPRPAGSAPPAGTQPNGSVPANGSQMSVEDLLAEEADGPLPFDLGNMSMSELINQAQAMGLDLASFGLSPDVVGELLRSDGHTVTEVIDVTPVEDNENAGTPPEFIEPDPTQIDELGLDALEDIEPDSTHAAQADEAAAATADTDARK